MLSGSNKVADWFVFGVGGNVHDIFKKGVHVPQFVGVVDVEYKEYIKQEVDNFHKARWLINRDGFIVNFNIVLSINPEYHRLQVIFDNIYCLLDCCVLQYTTTTSKLKQ